MKFQPKSEDDINNERLCPEGVYPFEVLKATEGKSKSSGADMITLKLRVFVGAEDTYLIDDYLLDSVAYKLFHFCSYTGLAQKYESGTLADKDCEGKTGYLKMGIQKGKKKDDGGVWPDRNTVKDYVRGDGIKPNRIGSPTASEQPASDDVPF
jgi:hypothetical protein